MQWYDWLWEPSNLTPHGFCLLWQPGLIWSHAAADMIVALSYFSIPAALLVYVRHRPEIAFGPVLWLFGAFIFFCGAGHIMDLITLWVPVYRLEVSVKIITAVISLLTAISLWLLMPQALAIPSQGQLRDVKSALSESEALRQALFEHSPAPMMTQDLEGKITDVSESWLSLFGYKRAEIVGHYLSEFLQADAAGVHEAEWQRLLAAGLSPELERQLVAKAGTLVDVLLKKRVVRRASAKWVITALTDLTAVRRAEKALQAAEGHLRQSQKMESIGQLTGGIAHDFNNALAAITGSLERILMRIPPDRPDIAAILDTVRQAADRAAGLTAQLLSFSRRQRLEPRPVDPVRIAYDLLPLVRRTLGARIAMLITEPEHPVFCLADRHQLESAILNLVINARDAISGGGTITISVAARRVSDEGCGDAATGDYVQIAVTDTGSGMTAEIRRRAFEPFFTTKPPGEGTGLGLSQIHGFAHQSGGAAFIESTLGQGTTVSILLPCVDAPNFPQDVPAELAADGPSGRGEQLLLVEDDELVRATFHGMMLDLGYDIVEAATADAAIPLLDNPRLRVVLTDFTMPGTMDGLQFAELVLARHPEMPILLLTGHFDPFRGRQVPPGVTFVQKPCDSATLSRLLQRALATGSAQLSPATIF